MTEAQKMEQIFDSYSPEKQEKMLLDLFRTIRDKGYVYNFLCTVAEREMDEQIQARVLPLNRKRNFS